jgi:hypothetical protein
MRLGSWNVRSLYRAGSVVTVSKKLSKYRIDLVGEQEVGWEGGGTELEREYTFSYEKENEDHELRTGFFMRMRIISPGKRVEFVSDWMSYIIFTKRSLVSYHCSECSCPNRR